MLIRKQRLRFYKILVEDLYKKRNELAGITFQAILFSVIGFFGLGIVLSFFIYLYLLIFFHEEAWSLVLVIFTYYSLVFFTLVVLSTLVTNFSNKRYENTYYLDTYLKLRDNAGWTQLFFRRLFTLPHYFRMSFANLAAFGGIRWLYKNEDLVIDLLDYFEKKQPVDPLPIEIRAGTPRDLRRAFEELRKLEYLRIWEENGEVFARRSLYANELFEQLYRSRTA